MRLRPATKAWIGLASYVVAADTYLIYRESKNHNGYHTMSTAFEDALQHPVRRWQVSVAWALVSIHLFDLFLPEQAKPYEPINAIGKFVTNRVRDHAVSRYDDPLQFLSA